MWIEQPPTFSIGEMITGLEPGKFIASPTDERGRYLHWDDLRHRPLPEQFRDLTEYWRYLKMIRLANMRSLPLQDKNQHSFIYCPVALEQHTFKLDQLAAGNIGGPTTDAIDSKDMDRYLINGLMDEAIHSSQLEGAATTYLKAKTMLRQQREPRDRSERMIFNNYRAMRRINDDFQRKPLSPEMVRELHSILTSGTLKNRNDLGRLRNCDADDDDFGVYFHEKLIHKPPPWQELPMRLQALCDFANASEQNPFVHPATRAMILHFMLAYDHPFIDGNGRTARGLFYWAMARSGYWLMHYTPISAVIQGGTRDYLRAFLLSETDSGETGSDITYFLIYHIEVALRALQTLENRIKEKTRDLRYVENQLQSTGDWNPRQITLVRNALRKPNAKYSSDSHADRHNITKPTAIADLDRLTAAGLLKKHRRGNRFIYTPAADLPARLKSPDVV